MRTLPGSVAVPFLALLVLWPVTAAAQPGYPSEQEVADAHHAEASAAGAVANAEQRLAAANRRLDDLAWSAAHAAEESNGARYLLAEAEEAAATAERKARRAAAESARAHAELGQVAAANYRDGGQLATLGLVLQAGDTAQLMSGAAALQSITRSQSTIYERAVDASASAEQTAAEAHQAVVARQFAADEARRAFDRAAAAVAEFENLIASAERERDAALAELAAARGTTVALEEERQAGLAADQAAQSEQAAGGSSDSHSSGVQPASAGADPADSGNGVDDAPVGAASKAPSREPAATSEPSPAPAASPTPSPAAPPTPSPDVPSPTSPAAQPAAPPPTPSPVPPSPTVTGAPPAPSSTAADRAIAYAYAQVGKPYQWGAAGPDAFDCSGLTMRAWQQGGKQLPHWSVAQARMVTRVSYAELRPGDLIFWSDNGQPSGTYHVGLFIGDGLMIHAPRPGKTVEVQRVFYWRTPSFYGRV